MPPTVRHLVENQQAATLIEYSLIVALIATVAVGTLGSVGGNLRNVMNAVVVAMG